MKSSEDLPQNHAGADSPSENTWKVAEEAEIRARIDQSIGASLSRPAHTVALRLENLQITDDLIPWLIDRLQSVQQPIALNLYHNRIGDFGSAAIAERLPQLTELNLTANNIRVSGAVAIGNSHGQLKRLLIGHNEIGDDGAVAILRGIKTLRTLDLQKTKISNDGVLRFAQEKNALTSLNLSLNYLDDTAITHLCKHSRQLRRLFLSSRSGRYRFTDDAALAIASSLTDLVELDLAGSRIGDDGMIALGRSLARLRVLNLSNNMIRDVDAVVDLLKHRLSGSRRNGGRFYRFRQINLSGNPLSWRDPDRHGDDPYEYVNAKVTSITSPKQLLRRLLAGPPPAEYLVARAVMMGEGSHGKTHLVRWLTDHSERHELIPLGPSSHTVGFHSAETRIDIRNYSGTEARECVLTLIDCGGQHEQIQSHHNLVHRASSRTLFILCVHAGKEFKTGNRADYYLRMLETCFDNSLTGRIMVLVVATHCDVSQPLDLPSESELKRRYPRLSTLVVRSYSSKTGEGIDQVRQAIAYQVAHMAFLVRKVPYEVRQVQSTIKRLFQAQPNGGIVLARRGFRTSIKWRTFQRICEKHGIRQTLAQLDCVRELIEMCEIVVPGFEGTSARAGRQCPSMFLNPSFINRYVHELITNERLRFSRGFMRHSEFEVLTGDLNSEQRRELLDLLRKYLVVFDWTVRTDTGVITEGMLIPDLLPLRSKVNLEKWLESNCGATLEFHKFLGEWRLFELMAKHERMLRRLPLREDEAQQNLVPLGVFRNECVIEGAGCRALVQLDVVDQVIEVSILGSDANQCSELREAIIHDLVGAEERDRVKISRWGAVKERDSRTQSDPADATAGIEYLSIHNAEVYVNGQKMRPMSQNSMIVLRKLMEHPIRMWMYYDLLPPPPGIVRNADRKYDRKRYQDYVRNAVKGLPAQVFALLEPSHGRHHHGRKLKDCVRTRID